MTAPTIADGIEVVLGLAIGDRFVVRGREFALRDYAGTSHYEGRSVFPAWNESGRATTVTVKAADRVEVRP